MKYKQANELRVGITLFYSTDIRLNTTAGQCKIENPGQQKVQDILDFIHSKKRIANIISLGNIIKPYPDDDKREYGLENLYCFDFHLHDYGTFKFRKFIAKLKKLSSPYVSIKSIKLRWRYDIPRDRNRTRRARDGR